MDVTRFLTWRRLAALVAATAVLSLTVFFVADNYVLVEVRIFTFEVQARLAWALIIAFAIGALAGVLLSRLRWRWR